MLLGKRPRGAVNSSSDINESEPSDRSEKSQGDGEGMRESPVKKTSAAVRGGPSSYDHFPAALYGPSPPPAVEMPHFLTICELCKQRLLPGNDIYMYRGDRGFCSSECRDVQIKRDEKEEKRAMKEKSIADQ